MIINKYLLPLGTNTIQIHQDAIILSVGTIDQQLYIFAICNELNPTTPRTFMTCQIYDNIPNSALKLSKIDNSDAYAVNLMNEIYFKKSTTPSNDYNSHTKLNQVLHIENYLGMTSINNSFFHIFELL